MRRAGASGENLVSACLRCRSCSASMPFEVWSKRLSSLQESKQPLRRDGRPDQPIVQDALWKIFMADPSRSVNNRSNKTILKYADPEHSTPREGLWLGSPSNPGWVETRISRKELPAAASTAFSPSPGLLSQSDGHPPFRLASGNDFEAWIKLCGEGQLIEAFEVLDLMERSGIKVPAEMLHHLLKQCVKRKNLGVGRRAHALSTKNGYESNSVLGAHFIRLYSLRGELLQAAQVFSRLPVPDTLAWNAIISAYSENRRAWQAIQLYHHMRQSNVRADDYTFVTVLKACSSARDLSAGKLVHSDVMEKGCKSNAFLDSILMDMYSKCGSLEDARQVFDSLSKRDVVTWTAMIAGYAQRGIGEEALKLFHSMLQDQVTPDSFTYVSILKACASIGVTQHGKQIHAQILQRGLETDSFIGSALVDMYAKCGSLDDARLLFDRLPKRNVVTWSAILNGYAQQGLGQDAFKLYEAMKQEGIMPDKFVFAIILKACASIGADQDGQRVYAEIMERGLQGEVVVGNTLVDMFVKCGNLEKARKVFDTLPVKSTMTWGTMFAGYAQQGLGHEAVKLYKSMQQQGLAPDQVAFVSILKACGTLGDKQEGQQIHAQIVDAGLQDNGFVGSALVDMYAKCGSLEDARKVFDSLPSKDLVTWSAMITGYTQHGFGHEALQLYLSMQQHGIVPDHVTFVTVLKACSSIGAIQEGKWIHSQIQERGLAADVFVGSTLVDMYAKCGSLEDAQGVFDRLPSKDVVTWSALIVGYAEHGLGDEALKLYERMQQDGMSQANEVTFTGILKACSIVGDLQKVKQVHADILDRGLEKSVIVGNTLIDTYAKCGSLDEARTVFDGLSEKDVVTWSSMIAGYAQYGLGLEALQLYMTMQLVGIIPDVVTAVIAVKACGSVGALHEGRQIHSHIVDKGLVQDLVVGNTLVDMYAKCGSLHEARTVFAEMPTRDVVTWNALINGYGQHNEYAMAIQCFKEMQEEGLGPDAATFTALLVACSLAGLVSEGKQYLNMMVEKYSISPGVEHYTCMVDLLGRSGHLEEAENVLLNMPLIPDSVGWMSLLSACKTHGNVELGRRCFDQLVQIDPHHAAAYVLMSNIYESAGRWRDVHYVESVRERAGAQKKLATAFIEVNNKVHQFTVGADRADTSAKLQSLNARAKEDADVSLQSLSDKEREDALCGHAEKLALAFGLLNTPEGATLLVVKNLRMCHHCHSGTKIISSVEKREIIVRDAHRVHHFRGGVCSCGEDR